MGTRPLSVHVDSRYGQLEAFTTISTMLPPSAVRDSHYIIQYSLAPAAFGLVNERPTLPQLLKYPESVCHVAFKWVGGLTHHLLTLPQLPHIVQFARGA
jgi:hypothetical protein